MIPVTSDKKELFQAIDRRIDELCIQLGKAVLPLEEQLFLVETYSKLIDDLATKYIKGHIEHSDSPFFSIDFKRESYAELLDDIHFRAGERYVQSGRLDQIRKLLAGNGDIKGRT